LLGGLLGDEMGLGKTIQVISFAAAVFHKTNTSEDLGKRHMVAKPFLHSSVPRSAAPATQTRARMLVIASPSLLANWQREITQWSFLSVARVHGANKLEVIPF
jgi:SNF2 family DNA or RNA helicase